MATVTISGLNVTVRPIASAVMAKYGTSGNATLTLTKVTTENGSVQSDDLAQPIVLVMNVKKATPALSFASASKTVSIGTSAASPHVVNATDDMTLTWRSADNSIATVNAETGVVTPIAEGTTTITATFAGSKRIATGTASFKLVVSSPVGIDGIEAEGSAETTYDLGGRRLKAARRGVNIITSTDGKSQKVLKK